RRPGTGSGGSIWIFLAPGRLAAKTLVSGCWISLDFLGFSRPNRYISMGYAGFPLKNFSLAFFPSAVLMLRRGSPILVVRKGKLVHGASLPYFLLFWNQLSSSRLLS